MKICNKCEGSKSERCTGCEGIGDCPHCGQGACPTCGGLKLVDCSKCDGCGVMGDDE